MENHINDFTKLELKAVVDGEIIPIEEVDDQIFAQKMIGDGFGIMPTGKEIVAPISGRIEEIASTNHAIYLSAPDGLKLLIHIGIDTIALKGEGFSSNLEKGMSILAGDILVHFDPVFIKNEGYNPVVSTVILEQADKKIEITTYPAKEAVANETIALTAKIWDK